MSGSPVTILQTVHRLPDGVKDLDFASVRGGPAGAGPLLAATCEDGKCSLWDVASSTQLCTLQLPKGA